MITRNRVIAALICAAIIYLWGLTFLHIATANENATQHTTQSKGIEVRKGVNSGIGDSGYQCGVLVTFEDNSTIIKCKFTG